MGKETYLKQALFGSVLSLFPGGKIPSLSDKQRLWTEFIEPGSTSFPPGYLAPWENPAFSAFSGHVFFQFFVFCTTNTVEGQSIKNDEISDQNVFYLTPIVG